MNYLALDPSLTCYGWSIINTDTNTIIDYGCIRTKKDTGKVSVSDTNRIIEIASTLVEKINQHNVFAAMFEDPAGSKSSTANKALSLVKGVTIGVLISKGIPFEQIRARDAKHTLCGSYDATKEEMFNKVCNSFPDFKDEMNKKPKYLLEAVSDSISVYLAIIKKRGIKK